MHIQYVRSYPIYTDVHLPSASLVYFTESIKVLIAQGVKQSVRPSVVDVVVGTKIVISRLLGICACYKQNQLIDNGEKHASNCSKRLTGATNCAFSVQYACGLSTTPTLLALYYYADAIVHAQAQCCKGSQSHKTALLQSMEG